MKENLILAAIAVIVVILSASAGVVAAYMTLKHGASFGLMLIAFTIGAVLLIDWKGGRNDRA